MKYINKLTGLFIILSGMTSCFSEYIDKKPDQKLVVPTSVSDFQALLDQVQDSQMNVEPTLGFIASDDFYITDAGFNALSDIQQAVYLWADDVYGSDRVIQDWARPYRQIFRANVVLEGMANIKKVTPEGNLVKGSALYFRAMAYYNLAQLFRPPYSKNTADHTAGIPLKSESDVTQKPEASTLQQTYEQIINDLNDALLLLPGYTEIKSRPDQKAANALLARVYLTMGLYEQAEAYADRVLSVHPALIDYNTLLASSNRPFPPSLPYGNEEVLFHSVLSSGNSYIGNSLVSVDSLLFDTYDENDLRKVLFFQRNASGLYTFKGSYSPSLLGNYYAFFSGLAVDEMYLIRAECRARNNKTALALEDLNLLLSSRWRTGTYVPVSNLSSEDALKKILEERRKQLVGRGLRWSDLRRLNQEGPFATEVQRLIRGQKYVLAPGDHRYTFPIPEEEIRETIEQNPR